MILLNAHDHGMISPYRRTGVLSHTAFKLMVRLFRNHFYLCTLYTKKTGNGIYSWSKEITSTAFQFVQSTVVSREYPAVPVAVVFFIFHSIDFISGKMSR